MKNCQLSYRYDEVVGSFSLAGIELSGRIEVVRFKGRSIFMNGKFNLWYVLVGVAFIVAGAYKIVLGSFTSGFIWIVIGVLFGILSRYSNHNEDSKDKSKKKK